MENFFKLCLEKLDSNSELHKNGQCIIWKGSLKNGYGQFRFKDPRTPDADHKTRTVHRMALMVKHRNLDVASKQQASHLCNNKTCINTEHLTFEDNFTNNGRKLCFFNRKCFGHGDGKPSCLVDLDESTAGM